MPTSLNSLFFPNHWMPIYNFPHSTRCGEISRHIHDTNWRVSFGKFSWHEKIHFLWGEISRSDQLVSRKKNSPFEWKRMYVRSKDLAVEKLIYSRWVYIVSYSLYCLQSWLQTSSSQKVPTRVGFWPQQLSHSEIELQKSLWPNDG